LYLRSWCITLNTHITDMAMSIIRSASTQVVAAARGCTPCNR